MSSIWRWFQATAIGPVAAGAAIGMTWRTAAGRASATSSATIPPSEPPTTSSSRSMPSASSKSPLGAGLVARRDLAGRRAPYGRRSAGRSTSGRWSRSGRRAGWRASTPNRSVSSARPGPMSGAHQSPAASAEPVRAWMTRTCGASPAAGPSWRYATVSSGSVAAARRARTARARRDSRRPVPVGRPVRAAVAPWGVAAVTRPRRRARRRRGSGRRPPPAPARGRR